LRGSAAQGVGLALIILAATVPFLAKAFHVDDPLYLAVSRQILVKPWDPYGANVLWERSVESLFDADFNPPLWSYLLAGVMSVTGEPTVRVVAAGTSPSGETGYRAVAPSRLPELAMHAVESLFVAIAIIALFCLSKRYVPWPLTSTALVALSPMMLPGQNVMLEGPVMAFWLGCCLCYLQAVETGKDRWRLAAGALGALAVMTKYTSALVLILVVIDAMRRRRWRDLSIVGIPVVVLFLWSLHNWIVYERLHALVIFSRAQTGGREPVGVQLYETWGRSFALCRVIGATTALVIPAVPVFLRRFGFWPMLLLFSFALVVGWVGKLDMGARLIARDGRRPTGVFPETIPAHVICFGAAGAFALMSLVIASRSRPHANRNAAELGLACDESFLWIWAGLVIAFGVFATPFLAVRHLLPGVPPLVWLMLRRLQESFPEAQRAWAHGVLGFTVAASSIGGFLVAKADYDFAGWYRHLALDVASRTVAVAKDQGITVWYTGHWGWAYYAERAGAKPYIPSESHMVAGDYLLLPQLQTWQLPPRELYPYLKGKLRPIRPVPHTPNMTGIAAIDQALHWCLTGVRSISNEVHLYGPGTLMIPWQFSHQPLDFFNVIEVQPAEAAEGD
jgi:hypothetical protein